MFIEQPPEFFRRLYPGALFRIPPAQGEAPRVFLTFDDGPVPSVTPGVLDILDEFNAKATFFMVGQNIERFPQLLQEVKKRGHAVGSHTLHHLKGLSVSAEKYIEDARIAASLVGSRLFRPPHGLLSRRQFSLLAGEFTIVMYDVVTRDYSKRLNVKDVVDNVKKYTRDGSIIVFHDSLKSKPRLFEALSESIGWLKKEGYECRSLKSFI